MTEISYAKDHISFFASYRSPERHSHFAKHFFFSEDGDFDCQVDGDSFRCTGVCIDSGAVHAIRSRRGSVFVMLIDETSELSRVVQDRYLRGRPYAVIDGDVLGNTGDYREADDRVLRACAAPMTKTPEFDERIADVLAAIDSRESIDSGIVKDLSSVACLSQSRLSHLFREQVRTSLSSYLAMAKMKKAFFYAMSGESITAASVDAGFYSPSHYAAACKRMFGISFSTLQNSRYLKAVRP